MSLSDIMGHMDLSVYAQVALLLFMIAFCGIVGSILKMGRGLSSHMAALPLDDTDTAPSEQGRAG